MIKAKWFFSVLFAIILVFCSVISNSNAASVLSMNNTALKGGNYAGTIKYGKNFKFTLSKDGKQVSSVSANVLEYCGGSSYSSWTTVFLKGPFPVKNNAVSVSGKEKQGKLTLTYKFNAAFTADGKATGSVDQSTIVAGNVCLTHKLAWSAKKQ